MELITYSLLTHGDGAAKRWPKPSTQPCVFTFGKKKRFQPAWVKWRQIVVCSDDLAIIAADSLSPRWPSRKLVSSSLSVRRGLRQQANSRFNDNNNNKANLV